MQLPLTSPMKLVQCTRCILAYQQSRISSPASCKLRPQLPSKPCRIGNSKMAAGSAAHYGCLTELQSRDILKDMDEGADPQRSLCLNHWSVFALLHGILQSLVCLLGNMSLGKHSLVSSFMHGTRRLRPFYPVTLGSLSPCVTEYQMVSVNKDRL